MAIAPKVLSNQEQWTGNGYFSPSGRRGRSARPDGAFQVDVQLSLGRRYEIRRRGSLDSGADTGEAIPWR
jgi:hypothetical protein